MKKTLVILSMIAATSVQAEHHKKIELSDVDKCYINAVEKYPGHVLSMESEIENDRLIYEFDIMTKDGNEVEVECDARKHTLHDFEIEYKKGDKKFTNAAKISESEAEKIALEKYDGKVVDREYSIENGNPSYEFDIYVAKKGHEYEVEVDAVTGEILEVEMELYDIGSDD
ncbi:PepSY domain-containing protein [Methylophilaceae bacterium]|nr:PepSY domain-containing protein [bacterium]MDC0932171.1 PepSY domain-containing protein [Methylophilaceae bacterium]